MKTEYLLNHVLLCNYAIYLKKKRNDDFKNKTHEFTISKHDLSFFIHYDLLFFCSFNKFLDFILNKTFFICCFEKKNIKLRAINKRIYAIRMFIPLFRFIINKFMYFLSSVSWNIRIEICTDFWDKISIFYIKMTQYFIYIFRKS
jgi:hypothetical protein